MAIWGKGKITIFGHYNFSYYWGSVYQGLVP